MSAYYEVISLLSLCALFTNAGVVKRQVLTVYSGEGIQNHFDKYYGSRKGYQDWPVLHGLNYRDRNVLCLITYKATNMTTDLTFRTTKSPGSVLPYYIHDQDRTLEINVNRCFVSRFKSTEFGEQKELPWYEFYLAEAERDDCAYRFSFPRARGKEKILLEDSGVHALKLICDIDFCDYEL